MERQDGKTNEPEALIQNTAREDNRLVHPEALPRYFFCDAPYVHSHRDCDRRFGESREDAREQGSVY